MDHSIKEEELRRNLKNRHIQMIAIGGAIGVGLFYGSAGAISMTGPSITLAYLIGGFFIFLIMRALGELSVATPVSGSFSAYATLYLGRFAGFFSGWTYWFQGITTVMAELSVVGIYLQFWFPDFPKWITALVILALLVTVNLINVKAYGEFEFWFALIKVVAIICMIIFGILMIFVGFGNGGNPVGLSNLWVNGGFFAGGLKGFLMVFILVAFAFGGVELIGVTAGEADDPQKSIPKAVNKVFWRIMIFYVGALAVMVTLYPWNQIGTQGSPFVLVFDKVGIPAAASIINFVVLTAALSGMNSALYAITRLLYNLSLNNNAPKAFGKVNKAGVPYVGIWFSAVVALIAVVLNYIVPAKVFDIISSVTVVAIITAWGTILLAQIKFRKEKLAAGEETAFKMPFWPVSSYLGLAFLAFLIIAMAFLAVTRVALYVAPVWVLLLVILYHFLRKGEQKAAGIGISK
ncbi:amino acid permease [Candidatus Formimonas warabiya]|uniref:Aromatic amino acid transporter AroP n=1 Tax=Formimonas warabiya TaxID=1761012 RepID=A0A3G1KRJ0_FORW1|nr:amino acid permease [Candidatus Formimonas warabiya]ATW25079.1 aromatic amino acid transporter AroP [Candidatus Formimonas warabiya]